MFLDDQLHQITKETVLRGHNDFVDMINELYKICDNKWKKEFFDSKSKKEIKSMFDQVFNGWDLFVKKLEKENYKFSDEVKKYSYKIQFMENEELNKFYKKLG